MKIFIEKENKVINKRFSGKVKKLLSELNIIAGTVIIVKDNELITEEDNVKDSDSIKILSVISGG